MTTLLDFTCGFSWTAAYIAAIVRGYRHKTWCIPALSICMNFSWEFCAVLNRVMNGSVSGLPFAIQLSWLTFDIGILVSWLLFDRKGKRLKYRNLLLFPAVFFAVFWATWIAEQWEFSVFLINVIMSAEFIYRLSVDDAQWTSCTIAITKLIGTLAATILNGLIFWNLTVLWLGGICLILDGNYVLRLMKSYKMR